MVVVSDARTVTGRFIIHDKTLDAKVDGPKFTLTINSTEGQILSAEELIVGMVTAFCREQTAGIHGSENYVWGYKINERLFADVEEELPVAKKVLKPSQQDRDAVMEKKPWHIMAAAEEALQSGDEATYAEMMAAAFGGGAWLYM